jgi:hypothetical protein
MEGVRSGSPRTFTWQNALELSGSCIHEVKYNRPCVQNRSWGKHSTVYTLGAGYNLVREAPAILPPGHKRIEQVGDQRASTFSKYPTPQWVLMIVWQNFLIGGIPHDMGECMGVQGMPKPSTISPESTGQRIQMPKPLWAPQGQTSSKLMMQPSLPHRLPGLSCIQARCCNKPC